MSFNKKKILLISFLILAFLVFPKKALAVDSVTDRFYTGQIKDDTGLYYYNARYYDPQLGIFTSADRAQGPNRYGYVGGNPIMRNDPTGNIFNEDSDDLFLRGNSNINEILENQVEKNVNMEADLLPDRTTVTGGYKYPNYLYNVPLLQQGYNECVPTSVAMILQYYYNLGSVKQKYSKDEVIKILGGNPRNGYSIIQISPYLGNMNMEMYWDFSSSYPLYLPKVDIVAALFEGPLVASVNIKRPDYRYGAPEKLNSLENPGPISTNTDIRHAVVLTGYDERGNKVYINDPISGKKVLTWEQFAESHFIYLPYKEGKPLGVFAQILPQLKK